MARPGKAEAAEETAALLVRILGEHAFDTDDSTADQTRTLAEAWARHMLIAAPHPDRPNEPSSLEARDFVGVRRFVESLRRSELRFVRRALTEFRQVVWSVVQNMQRALHTDGEDDQALQAQIESLQRASKSHNLDQLRREVSSVVVNMASIIETRERRRMAQVEMLGLELKSLHQRLEEARKSSETDALTGLHNRRALDSYLERVAEFDGLTGVPVVLMIIDLDNFKHINDEYGHPCGDDVLRAVGRVLLKVFLRKCDFVARYGGEEFAVVMRDTNMRDAKMLAERLRLRMADVSVDGLPEVVLSASVGLSDLRSTEDLKEWVCRADNALLKAKRTGKNRVVVAA